MSQSDRHGRINKRQSEECEHEFGIEIISFIKLSKSPRLTGCRGLMIIALSIGLSVIFARARVSSCVCFSRSICGVEMLYVLQHLY